MSLFTNTEHGLHHESSCAAEIAAPLAVLPDLVMSGSVVVRPGVVRYISQVLHVSFSDLSTGVFATQQTFYHFLPRTVACRHRQVGLHVILQNWEDVVGNLPEQGVVHHC